MTAPQVFAQCKTISPLYLEKFKKILKEKKKGKKAELLTFLNEKCY